MRKDLKELKEIFNAHPDPYTHISEKELNKKWAAVEASIDQPKSVLAFYKDVSSLIALLKDGHSNTRFPKFWYTKQRKKHGAFPYKVYLSNDDEMYVTKSFNDGKLPLGSKIIEINDITVDSFLTTIDPYISYEKKNFRNTIIDNDIEKYLYICFGHSDSTKVKYFSRDTLTATIPNMDYKKWKKRQRKDKEVRMKKITKGEPYAYENLSNGVGLITIYSFFTPNYTDYKIFLLETFKAIRHDKIHSLIIDIRGNYGGWPKVASNLFHYISNTHFKTMARSNMKVSYAYRKNLTDRSPSLKNAMNLVPKRRHYVDITAILSNPYDTFIKEDAFFNEPPETKDYEFYGNCYLLINRDSYSAASSFAATFQCYGMGPIIGEETGGTKIFRANPITEELSHSGVFVTMSTTKLFNTCYDNEFEGIKPNINYSPNIIQRISGVDTQLLYTQRIIKKVQQKKQ